MMYKSSWKLKLIQMFCSEWLLGFVIDYAWICKLLRDAAFTLTEKAVILVKKWLILENLADLNSLCIRKTMYHYGIINAFEFLEE